MWFKIQIGDYGHNNCVKMGEKKLQNDTFEFLSYEFKDEPN